MLAPPFAPAVKAIETVLEAVAVMVSIEGALGVVAGTAAADDALQLLLPAALIARIWK